MASPKLPIDIWFSPTKGSLPGLRGSRRRRVAVPIGVEKILWRAASDPAFCERLFADREAALDEGEEPLEPSERAMLTAVPDETLRAMVAHIDPKRHATRPLAEQVAIAAAIAVGTGVVLSPFFVTFGHASDKPWPRTERTEPAAVVGPNADVFVAPDDPDDPADVAEAPDDAVDIEETPR